MEDYTNKNNKTALVPLTWKHNNTFSEVKGFKKRADAHITYEKIYLFFFFLGVCFFAFGKIEGGIFEKFFSECENNHIRFLRLFPLLIFTFFNFASGFTVYAAISSVFYTTVISFFSGAAACFFACNVSGIGLLNVLGVLLVLGTVCFFSVIFSGITKGISYIAVGGIEKITFSDFFIYFVLFVSQCLFLYYGFSSVVIMTK